MWCDSSAAHLHLGCPASPAATSAARSLWSPARALQKSLFLTHAAHRQWFCFFELNTIAKSFFSSSQHNHTRQLSPNRLLPYAKHNSLSFTYSDTPHSTTMAGDKGKVCLAYVLPLPHLCRSQLGRDTRDHKIRTTDDDPIATLAVLIPPPSSLGFLRKGKFD